MTRANKKAELIDAAMWQVAQEGLANFSVHKASEHIGVSEALVYRHFGSKAELLAQCYLAVQRSMDQTPKPDCWLDDSNKNTIQSHARELWFAYFNALVNGGYRTLFYLEYREAHIADSLMLGKLERGTFFSWFLELFSQLKDTRRLKGDASPELLWSYIQDVTCIYAKRVINNMMPNTQASRDLVFSMLWGGLSGMLEA